MSLEFAIVDRIRSENKEDEFYSCYKTIKYQTAIYTATVDVPKLSERANYQETIDLKFDING